MAVLNFHRTNPKLVDDLKRQQRELQDISMALSGAAGMLYNASMETSEVAGLFKFISERLDELDCEFCETVVQISTLSD